MVSLVFLCPYVMLDNVSYANGERCTEVGIGVWTARDVEELYLGVYRSRSNTTRVSFQIEGTPSFVLYGSPEGLSGR